MSKTKIAVIGVGNISNAHVSLLTVDVGLAQLAMHSPFETVSKLDCYMTYAACKAVYQG